MDPLLRFEITSTNEPPAQASQNWLRALADRDAAEGSGLGKFFEWTQTVTPIVPPKRQPFPATTAQKQQRAELEARSRDVRHVLAAAELWGALRIEGRRWTIQDGVGAATLALALPRDGMSDLLAGGSVAPVGFDDYRASVQALKDSQVNPTSAAEELIIAAHDRTPQLALPVLIGMHRRDLNTLEYTCLVVDVVTAVASVATHRLKQRLMVPRPYDDPPFGSIGVVPAFEPGHTAYPGGHALIGHTLAVVLADLVGGHTSVRMTLDLGAGSLALHRERAGIHTHLDSHAGQQLGRGLGAALVAAVADPVHFAAWSAIYAAAAAEWQ